MSILLSDIVVWPVPKRGTIGAGLEARFWLGEFQRTGEIQGLTQEEKERTLQRRIIARLYGDISIEFEAFLKAAFPDGKSAGEISERTEKLRGMLKGEGRRKILCEDCAWRPPEERNGEMLAD
jgi:hypothetical protein